MSISPTSTEHRKSVVYLATNVVNGKRYIGITSRRLCWRKYSHFVAAERYDSPTHFHRAIRKHGRDKFTFEIVETYASFKEANDAEIRLIAELKPEYNIAPGGGGHLGYVPTEEARKKSSDRMKGKPSFWRGKKLPEQFFRAAAENRAKPETKERWATNRKKGSLAAAKRVVCLSDGLDFPSASAAEKHYGIIASSIIEVCSRSKKRFTAGGKVFRYFGDHDGGLREAEEVIAKAKKKGRVLEKPRYQKSVECLDDGRVFPSAKRAADFYGVNHSSLTYVARGVKHYNTVGGFRFRYVQGSV